MKKSLLICLVAGIAGVSIEVVASAAIKAAEQAVESGMPDVTSSTNNDNASVTTATVDNSDSDINLGIVERFKNNPAVVGFDFLKNIRALSLLRQALYDVYPYFNTFSKSDQTLIRNFEWLRLNQIKDNVALDRQIAEGVNLKFHDLVVATKRLQSTIDSTKLNTEIKKLNQEKYQLEQLKIMILDEVSSVYTRVNTLKEELLAKISRITFASDKGVQVGMQVLKKDASTSDDFDRFAEIRRLPGDHVHQLASRR